MDCGMTPDAALNKTNVVVELQGNVCPNKTTSFFTASHALMHFILPLLSAP